MKKVTIKIWISSRFHKIKARLEELNIYETEYIFVGEDADKLMMDLLKKIFDNGYNVQMWHMENEQSVLIMVDDKTFTVGL